MKQNVYRNMYLLLFNRVTQALCALEAKQPLRARFLLMRAQLDAEELYLEHGETELERWGDEDAK